MRGGGGGGGGGLLMVWDSLSELDRDPGWDLAILSRSRSRPGFCF